VLNSTEVVHFCGDWQLNKVKQALMLVCGMQIQRGIYQQRSVPRLSACHRRVYNLSSIWCQGYVNAVLGTHLIIATLIFTRR
jgi:hypothetical protein